MAGADGFTPGVATGPFDRDRQMFCLQAGAIIPLVVWADVCQPDTPSPEDCFEALNRAMGAGLPLDPGEIGRACEALFGAARPLDGRGYPRSADWILATPMRGVYLTVCLDGDDVERFGFGADKVPLAGGKAAFLARETRIRRALAEALAPIRRAMCAADATAT